MNTKNTDDLLDVIRVFRVHLWLPNYHLSERKGAIGKPAPL